MSILPVRNLGNAGVITDVDPFNLPFNAFTRAKNVSFDGTNIKRSPVFRTALDLSSISPTFVFGLFSNTSYDSILVGTSNYSIHEYTSGGTLAIKHTGSAGATTQAYTGTTLSNVSYVNRGDQAPLYRLPTQTSFTTLANWTSGHKCASLRSYKDFLVALDITEGSTTFPTRVRFSDVALANAAPSSWDATDTTKSSGFNDIVQMNTAIVDGSTLGSNFIIYSRDQVWLMEFVGGTFIMNFRKLFDDCGVINQNCIVEVEGRHYVFDRDDIYTTDAVSRQSICDGRVRNYIFNSIDTTSTSKCFTYHNDVTEEIYFCYRSADDMAEFTSGSECNRAAVFNYRHNSWSFMDLPNLISITTANLNNVDTYANSTLTYDTTGGTFHGQSDSYSRHPICISLQNTTDGLADNQMLALDHTDENTQVALPLYSAATKGIHLERIGLDLDQELGASIDTYKTIRRILPQISTLSTDKTFNFTLGSSDIPTLLPTYTAPQTFDVSTDYKLDTRESGRYLSYKIDASTVVKDFTISGFDLDLVPVGRR
jgi:hypothetical protein